VRADPIHRHLGNGELPFQRLATGLVVDVHRQAVQLGTAFDGGLHLQMAGVGGAHHGGHHGKQHHRHANEAEMCSVQRVPQIEETVAEPHGAYRGMLRRRISTRDGAKPGAGHRRVHQGGARELFA